MHTYDFLYDLNKEENKMLYKSLNTSDRLHILTHFSFFIFFRSFFLFIEMKTDFFWNKRINVRDFVKKSEIWTYFMDY